VPGVVSGRTGGRDDVVTVGGRLGDTRTERQMRAEGTALVTGASRGIGRAVAVELAARGFDVVATMRDPAAGVDLPVGIEVHALDVTRPDTIDIPAGLRVLINNAAVEGANLPVELTPIENWRHEFETNVFGLVEVTRRAIPSMRAAGGGVIVNITSAGLLVPMPFFAAYRASKAAVAAIGESLRTELAPHGIRVVEILPGPIDTVMLAGSAVAPDASDHDAYRRLAERVGELRGDLRADATPVGSAAAAIVDVVLDDAAPLRNACDAYGAMLLEGWGAATDERYQAGFLAAFAVDP